MHQPLGAFLMPIAFARPQRVAPSTWIEHVPFGMNLVQAIRPRTIVELGTQHGVSYCAFCQSAAAASLQTRCYAVDTWRGDLHTNEYGPEVLANLRAHHDQAYGAFSRLVQSTFDEAVGAFADGEIDLLHIDGFHTYEAVRHDFETWRPKLSDRAIVLFHDTSVRENGFGVGRFWSEVSAARPALEFIHGYGLGVLAVGEPPEALRPLFALDAAGVEEVRSAFFLLGQGMLREVELRELRETVALARADSAAAGTAADQARLAADRAQAEAQRACADLDARNAELEALRETTAWRAIARFRAAREKALPEGSLRRRLYDDVRDRVLNRSA